MPEKENNMDEKSKTEIKPKNRHSVHEVVISDFYNEQDIRTYCDNDFFKYEPTKRMPRGVRVRKTTCFKCYGTGRYSGVHMNHACEECSRGYIWEIIRKR